MRIKIKEFPDNKIRIKLRPDLDKNLIISFIITAAYFVIGLIVYLIMIYAYSEHEIMRKANQYYRNDNYLMAAKYYNKALKVNKNLGKAVYTNYGITLSKLGDYDLAIKYLKQSQEMDPSDSEKLYDLSHAFYLDAKDNSNKEKYLEAARYLERAISLDSSKDRYYILAGICYRNAGDYGKAMDIYKRTLAVKDISNAVFYNLMGDTVFENGNTLQAINYYNLAIEHDNSYILAYINLGDIYRSLHEYGTSLEIYKKALKENPESISIYIRLGLLYSELGKIYEAEQYLLQALKISSDNPDVFYNLGAVYQKMGKKKEAIEYFKRAAYFGDSAALSALKEMEG